MRIKRIEINGFKSFADKTEFELSDGLTAVVGPNGSGKSNLAEAVKWVLGEQSAKVLRGTRMDDVIFSGTAKRKSVGFAEVTLVFDNSANRLPIDLTEVAITRRVYRSGEGEYYINRKMCRLKDITELFLDTGIGKDSYSFVGQGRIDEILSSDPRNRRGIFEEAAGISRYKLRKRETESRLSETESNLRRIQDVAAELESQLGPLMVEAEKARSYLLLMEQRKTWEKELLLYEVALAERQTNSLRTQIERVKDEIIHLDSRLTVCEAEKSRASLAESVALASLQDAERSLYEKKVWRQQRIERKSDLENARERAEAQSRACLERVEMYESEVESLVSGVNSVREELTSNLRRLEELQAQLATYSQPELDEGILGEHSLQSELAAIEEQLIHLRGEISVREKQAQALSEQIDRKGQELMVLTNKKATQDKEHQELTSEAARLGARLADERSIHLSRNHEVNELRQELSKREERLKAEQATLFRVENRLRALRASESQMEGLSRGARFVLGLNLKGVLGVVGNLISTNEKYEVAIEVALGAAVADVVTDTEAAARRAIAILKEKGQGRATFYPLDTIKPRPARDIPANLQGLQGFFGRAVELVTADSKLQPVVQQLLGNTLIVNNLDTAALVARQTGHTWRIVTLDGDISLPGGSMTGGSRPERQAWLISRRRELEEAEREVESLRAAVTALELTIDSIRAKLVTESAREREAAQSVQVLERGAAELNQALGQVTSQREYLERECNNLELSISAHRVEMHSLLGEVSQLKDQLQDQKQLWTQCKGRLESLQESLEQERQQKAEEAERRTQVAIHLARVESLCKLAEQQIREREHGLVAARQRLHESKDQYEAARRLVDDCSARITELDNEILSLEEVISELDSSVEAYRTERNRLASEQQKLQVLLETTRADLNGAKQKMHNLELRIERVKAEEDFLRQKLSESYPGTEGQSSSLNSRSEAETAIALIDSEVASLGAVRVSSISECERIRERLGFLSGEQEDLRSAAGQLHSVIAELDKVMGERFIDGFGLVKKEFSEIAGRLFGGAAARLSLTDPDRPLESGIEVDVQPPGKRLQSINLLSGGERALVAIALLCAVIKVKPTPFCVLDEIDAPLDDANVDRLVLVLKELCANTQFLVITHTKGTMMAADTLYGVTMPEQGVSKVLAVKVSEIASA